MKLRTFSTGGCAIVAIVIPTFASAQTAQPPARHTPLEKKIGVPHANKPFPSLAVINAAGAKLEGGKLILCYQNVE